MEYQIVRRGLTGHIQPFPLGTADQLHRFLGGHMADMVGTACLLYQRQIPFHLLPLAGGGIASVSVCLCIGTIVDITALNEALVLTVGHNQFAQCLRPPHGLLHFFRVLHPFSIIRESHHMGGHLLQCGQRFPLLSHGNGAIGIGMNHAVPGNGL